MNHNDKNNRVDRKEFEDRELRRDEGETRNTTQQGTNREGFVESEDEIGTVTEREEVLNEDVSDETMGGTNRSVQLGDEDDDVIVDQLTTPDDELEDDM
jgi:hypothetical protein